MTAPVGLTRGEPARDAGINAPMRRRLNDFGTRGQRDLEVCTPSVGPSSNRRPLVDPQRFGSRDGQCRLTCGVGTSRSITSTPSRRRLSDLRRRSFHGTDLVAAPNSWPWRRSAWGCG